MFQDGVSKSGTALKAWSTLCADWVVGRLGEFFDGIELFTLVALLTAVHPLKHTIYASARAFS
jgi:hypothetical protein